MIASKVVCDDTYSNKSWAVVGQGMFQLREINQMEREMCGYLEWQLNIDYVELASFTEKTEMEFGAGVPNPHLPVSSSIAPSPANKVAAASSASRLSPSYDDGASAASPATLITSAGDEDEEAESPSNSLTSSPASSALQTPPSNADIDGHDDASVIMMPAGANGVLGGVGMNASGVFVHKPLQTNNVSSNEAAKIKASLSRDRAAFASAARW